MGHSVLVAEDDASIVEALQFLMESAGFNLHIARDGNEALAYLKNHVPDLILLDVMMPGCDGFEVATTVRNDPRCKDVRILMLTAKTRPIDEQKAKEIGVDAFVTKPFSTRDVVAKVKALLEE